MRKNILKNQQGATAIFMVLIILSGVLIVGLGLADLIMTNIKMGGVQTQSTKAYFAAETGLEKIIYKYKKDRGDMDFSSSTPDISSSTLSNDSSYKVDYYRWEDEDYDHRKFVSVGSFGGVRRSAEAELTYYNCMPDCDNETECCEGVECGSVTDGCDKTYNCGDTCSDDEYCDDNVCTSVFPPGCSEEGDKRCDPDNEKKVQKCEDPDNDGVFEWVYYKDCKFGWSCDEGECSEPFCEDSDDDIDIDEKGRACYGEECCEDDCKDSNTVLECICSSKDNEPEKVEESCGDDSICDGDKCVE